jgi:cytochrome bd ubiquinol oxidase subunit I
MEALTVDRLQFAFTATFHYLFPQLTMGLALLIIILKTLAVWKGREDCNRAAKFWASVFGISFVFGVVTGIPLEFQFGTNWARFSRQVGGVIGQTLAMEGVFAFFLESTFLGLFLYGEKRLGKMGHWWAAFLVFVGSWFSGFFIIATNAWMQHPVAYAVGPDGNIQLLSIWGLLLNPWILWQYIHNMSGAVVTASFAMAALGAFYLLSNRHIAQARIYVRLGVITGCICSLMMLFPSGHEQARMIARHQPASLAAMEALFDTTQGAPLMVIGQPNVPESKVDNPGYVPRLLSFLAYGDWTAEVKGLEAFSREQWPDNIPLLYYGYHLMVGLGTAFIAVMAGAGFLLWRDQLYESRWMMRILLLSFPLPFLANSAGWLTAELARQPWLVYGLVRTDSGYSHMVSGGNGLFTLIGFLGLYALLALLCIILIGQMIGHGPADSPEQVG